jgi:hypothetical protein
MTLSLLSVISRASDKKVFDKIIEFVLQNHSRCSNQLQFQLALQIAMKLLVFTFAVFLVISAKADNDEIDWSRVLPPMEVPGFWDSKPELKKLYYSSRTGRVVGGQEVKPHSIPHQAFLIMLSGNEVWTSCGGSLITVRTVLTAAHCVQNAVSTQVILGAHNRRTVEPKNVKLSLQQTHEFMNCLHPILMKTLLC